MDAYIEHFISVYNFKPLSDKDIFCLDYNNARIFFNITEGGVMFMNDEVFDEMFVHRKGLYFLIKQSNNNKFNYVVDAIYLKSNIRLSIRVIWAIKRIFEKYNSIWLNFNQMELKIDNKKVNFVRIKFNGTGK